MKTALRVADRTEITADAAIQVGESRGYCCPECGEILSLHKKSKTGG
jgi:hypothetical protein